MLFPARKCFTGSTSSCGAVCGKTGWSFPGEYLDEYVFVFGRSHFLFFQMRAAASGGCALCPAVACHFVLAFHAPRLSLGSVV
jgi:hypothetical protein